MPMANVTIPFLEGLKAGSGYSYDYNVPTHEPEFTNGKWIAEKINGLVGDVANIKAKPATSKPEVDELRKSFEDEISKLREELQQLKDEVAKKDARWGAF